MSSETNGDKLNRADSPFDSGIPPIIFDVIGSVVRHALTTTAGALVASGWITEDQSAKLIQLLIGVVCLGLTLAWSAWQKRNAKLRQLVAQLMPAGSTESQVQERIETAARLPSVMTLPSDQPVAR